MRRLGWIFNRDTEGIEESNHWERDEIEKRDADMSLADRDNVEERDVDGQEFAERDESDGEDDEDDEDDVETGTDVSDSEIDEFMEEFGITLD